MIQEGEKKKGKKSHGSYFHNLQHVDAGWLSLFLIPNFFLNRKKSTDDKN